MKKKISLLLLIILVFIININGVSAENSFSDSPYPVCGFDYVPSKLPAFTSGLFNLIKLLVPIILIVMGMIDFLRAMMSSDEKKMKDSQHRFVTRLIAAVIVFLIMAVVQFAFSSIAAGTDYKNGFANCMDCIFNGDIASCSGGERDLRKSCDDYEGKDCPIDVGDDYGNQCMQYNNGETYGGCKIKGYNCEDYTADECPPTTITGTYHCKEVNGVCKQTVNCESYTVNQCQSQHGDVCKWTGTDCVAK